MNMKTRENMLRVNFILSLVICLCVSCSSVKIRSDLNFGILAKGSIPSSGPSRGKTPYPFPKSLKFGMLPKGPVPPSGPSRGETPDPPYASTHTKLNVDMLPKDLYPTLFHPTSNPNVP
ncbi:hypothetical protein HKD37_10G029601 [Glycine soja]